MINIKTDISTFILITLAVNIAYDINVKKMLCIAHF